MAKCERSFFERSRYESCAGEGGGGSAGVEARGGGLLVVRRAALVVAIAAGLACGCASAAFGADTFDLITKLKDTSSATVWRIDEPDVRKASTSYPTIKFSPGDTVSIDAGGCVQTGGAGLTWKRYVDPSGPDSDHLYHGMIWIPGINDKLEKIQDFGPNKEHDIKSPLPTGVNRDDLYLRLGYEDNDYKDNGYYTHDDGVGNQCTNVGDAWVVVSIGHDGKKPVDPDKYSGITPETFRCEYGWAFVNSCSYTNFCPTDLSWSSFTNAFQLGALDYLDPLTYVTYLAGEGIASGGNCQGMVLLADAGEDQFTVGDLTENFWTNYKSTPAVTADINIAQWKQLSSYFLSNWLGTVLNSPTTNAETIEHDLTKDNPNFGMITIISGDEGHVLVPLQVSHSGDQTLIQVYDPNRPCSGNPDQAPHPPVVIQGENWSYPMGTGTWSGSGGGLGYVPYVGPAGWSDLGTNVQGVIEVIFSNGVKVEQVTDSTGKKLFVDGRPGVMDTSAQGFGRALVRVPKFSQASPKQARSSGPPFSFDHALKVPAAVTSQEEQLKAEYDQDYRESREIYLVTDLSLRELSFAISVTNTARPARVIFGHKGQFYELKLASGTASAIQPTLVIHSLSDLGSGATVQNRGGALKATVTSGVASAAGDALTIRSTDEIGAGAGTVKFQLTTAGDIQVFAAGAAAQTSMTTRVVGANGSVSTAPVRKLAIERPN